LAEGAKKLAASALATPAIVCREGQIVDAFLGVLMPEAH
jgi:hypothetical protein